MVSACFVENDDQLIKQYQALRQASNSGVAWAHSQTQAKVEKSGVYPTDDLDNDAWEVASRFADIHTYMLTYIHCIALHCITLHYIHTYIHINAVHLLNLGMVGGILEYLACQLEIGYKTY